MWTGWERDKQDVNETTNESDYKYENDLSKLSKRRQDSENNGMR
jgi:hypothetical protein